MSDSDDTDMPDASDGYYNDGNTGSIYPEDVTAGGAYVYPSGPYFVNPYAGNGYGGSIYPEDVSAGGGYVYPGGISTGVGQDIAGNASSGSPGNGYVSNGHAGDASNGDEATRMQSARSSVANFQTSPSNGLRDYNTIEAPQLPDYTRVQGQLHVTDWGQHSWRYTAREDRSGTGFEVRQMAIDDFDDDEVPDVSNKDYWAPKYFFGPPNQQPARWHALIERWGFPILEKAGFLNYYPSDSDDYMAPMGQFAKERNPNADPNEQIHPVLRREMWRGINDAQYKVLKQVLLLATALLDDPATLAIFHAIADVDSLGEFDDENHGKCKVLNIPATLSNEQEKEVYRKLFAMRGWVEWRFGALEDMMSNQALALTRRRLDKNNDLMRTSREHCHQSTITISETFFVVLKRYDEDTKRGNGFYRDTDQAMNDLVAVPEKRKPSNLDPTSAHERTCLVLAHTVVHEFFHAFNAAWFPRPDDMTPVSAWLQCNRSNELGNAAINYLLGGEPFTMHRYSNDAVKEHRQHCAVPYGLFSRVPWDLWDDMNDQFQKTKTAGTEEAFAARQVFYPVPQKYVHNMFTRETWEHQVPRYGIAALKVPHLEDWAITHKKPH